MWSGTELNESLLSIYDNKYHLKQMLVLRENIFKKGNLLDTKAF